MVLLGRERLVASKALLSGLILSLLGWNVGSFLRVLIVNVWLGLPADLYELEHVFLAAHALLSGDTNERESIFLGRFGRLLCGGHHRLLNGMLLTHAAVCALTAAILAAIVRARIGRLEYIERVGWLVGHFGRELSFEVLGNSCRPMHLRLCG